MELSGTLLDYFIVFWAGVLVSFTPCVYPVMPITASFIGGLNANGTRWMGFLLSLLYVFGMALTYCLLGLIAALTGKLFGQIQNNPFIFIAVANVLIISALMMFDVIPLPHIGINFQHKIKGKGILAVILFGMAAGFVVGPCTAPILGSLLIYVASKQNLLHGGSLLFVFSYGVGASLILIGTFSGFLANMPKSGPWLVRIKQFCAFIMLVAAQYFLIKAGQLLL
ncbi:MAG: sulfite exporter TauE/SafE family protein [Candidatus Omnitrophica bacterium]|nr:sulfite exporter TauE/SafE family protein [Candidatus Omnitrophota bacterium]